MILLFNAAGIYPSLNQFSKKKVSHRENSWEQMREGISEVGIRTDETANCQSKRQAEGVQHFRIKDHKLHQRAFLPEAFLPWDLSCLRVGYLIALLVGSTGDVLARGTGEAGGLACPHPRAIHCCMIHLLWPSTAASAEWRVLQGIITQLCCLRLYTRGRPH